MTPYNFCRPTYQIHLPPCIYLADHYYYYYQFRGPRPLTTFDNPQYDFHKFDPPNPLGQPSVNAVDGYGHLAQKKLGR